jgi:hypothetical protein
MASFQFNQAQIDWLAGADPTDPFVIARMPDNLGPKPVFSKPGPDGTMIEPPAGLTPELKAQLDAEHELWLASQPDPTYEPEAYGAGENPNRHREHTSPGLVDIARAIVQNYSTSGTMHDYAHASQLFVSNGYALTPKHTFMFYVFFDGMAGAEEGMLVKQCTLPKMSFDTKTVNVYNRPYIVQTKVHYDPVQITLHDDCSDVIRKFLFNYYKYYFADPSPGNEFGFRGQFSPYLRAIRIYSLFNKKFSEYILINPIIKNMSHPEHHVGQGGDVMQHTLTVEYESILLSGGTTSSNSVTGFMDLHYDSNSSPISGRTGNSPNPYTMGADFPNAPTGIPRDIYAGSYNGNVKKTNILDDISNVLGAGAGILGAINGARNGDIMGTIVNGASAITQIDNLMTGSKNTIPFFAANAMNNNLRAGYNPNSPVTIPSVGGLLSSMGGQSLTNTTNNFGARVSSMTGLPQTSAAGGVTQLNSQMSVYSNRDYGNNASAYTNASNMSTPMPSDLAATGVPVSTDNVRTVNAESTYIDPYSDPAMSSFYG